MSTENNRALVERLDAILNTADLASSASCAARTW
jgi:hypothetical protein